MNLEEPQMSGKLELPLEKTSEALTLARSKQAALKRVKKNKGSPGVDQRTLEALPDFRRSRTAREWLGSHGLGLRWCVMRAATFSAIAVTLSCGSAGPTGNADVGVNICMPPICNSLFVGPETQAVGHVVKLAAAVESGATVQWTQSGPGTGTFGCTQAAATVFTCTGAGAVTIQLGLTRNGCSTSTRSRVMCTDGSSGGGGAGGAGGSAGPVSGTSGTSGTSGDGPT